MPLWASAGTSGCASHFNFLTSGFASITSALTATETTGLAMLKKRKDNKDEMRAASRSQTLPASPQRQNMHAGDEDALLRESTIPGLLERQDRHAETSGAYEKRLPNVPLDADGYQLGPMELVGDAPITEEDYMTEVERLRRENADLKAQTAMLTEEWKQTAMELNSFRSEKTYERDDSFFIGKFKTLRYKITDWAKQNFSDNELRPKLKDFWSTSVKENMMDLAITDDYADKFMNSAQLRYIMVEAFVWKFILSNIMGDNGHIWAGRLRDAFGSIQRVLDPSKDPRFGIRSISV
jgi:hypothetical protein